MRGGHPARPAATLGRSRFSIFQRTHARIGPFLLFPRAQRGGAAARARERAGAAGARAGGRAAGWPTAAAWGLNSRSGGGGKILEDVGQGKILEGWEGGTRRPRMAPPDPALKNHHCFPF